jgi:hypothetical protein
MWRAVKSIRPRTTILQWLEDSTFKDHNCQLAVSQTIQMLGIQLWMPSGPEKTNSV